MPKEPKIFINLTPEENKQLQTLELNPNINHKVRLRASILRLSNLGWDIQSLSQHFNRHNSSIKKDFDRWSENGVAGLCDGITSGRPPRLSQAIQDFIKECLAQDRIWNTQLLIQALFERFTVKITREPLRLYLLEMGYSWKRARYSSSKPPPVEEFKDHQASLETLKKGHWTRN
jgi:transposase